MESEEVADSKGNRNYDQEQTLQATERSSSSNLAASLMGKGFDSLLTNAIEILVNSQQTNDNNSNNIKLKISSNSSSANTSPPLLLVQSGRHKTNFRIA